MENTRLQASARLPDTLDTVMHLLDDARFDFSNPNRIRALLGGLAHGNPSAFHREDGAGYRLLGDEILRIDAFNPQMGASLAGLLAPWRRYAPKQRAGMHAELERLAAEDLSDNTREILNSALVVTLL